MDQTLETLEETSFAKDLAKDMGKAAAINAAAIVGVLGGLVAVGAILEWKERRTKKKAAAEQQ